MRHILFILFVFVFATSCQEDVGITPFPYKTPFSIMIWNQGLFNYGLGVAADYSNIVSNVELIDNYIDSNDCDICFFTEYASYLDNDKCLSANDLLYKDRYVYWFCSGVGYESKGIVSKFPFYARSKSFNVSDRLYIKGQFYINECLIHYVLIHLTPGQDSEAGHQMRIKELEELLSDFKPSDRVIIVGDFNTPQKYMHQELKVLFDHGFTIGNGYLFGTYPTWSNDPNDNIAVKNLKLVNFNVDSTLVRSDHKMCKAIIDIL